MTETTTDRDQEALDTLPNGALGQAFWPPKRLAALRTCVKLIAVTLDGLSTEAKALALISLAEAGNIPQSLILKVWQQEEAMTGWRAGDKHQCPRYSNVHTATSKCADYAVQHGDRTYLGEGQ